MYLVAEAGGLVGEHVPADLQVGDHHEGGAEEQGEEEAAEGEADSLSQEYFLVILNQRQYFFEFQTIFTPNCRNISAK